jgi:hypothetical protein
LNLTTKKIIVLLILVVLISLGLKLYFIDFSIPYNTDNLGYIIRGFSHLSGDFSQTPDKGIAWSLHLKIAEIDGTEPKRVAGEAKMRPFVTGRQLSLQIIKEFIFWKN